MALPKVDVPGRQIVLLSGFKRSTSQDVTDNQHLCIVEPEKLKIAALLHRDAIAFGYVRGQWMPAA